MTSIATPNRLAAPSPAGHPSGNLVGLILEQARRARADEGEAIAEGLARTGGAAVLFDATVVRVAIGPALLRLAGRWSWWPGTGC
jgi:hypothetical protein